MQPNSSRLSGSTRAAALLMTLGEQVAANVLKHLAPREMQMIGSAMAQMPAISRGQVEQLVTEFNSIVEDRVTVGIGTEEYLRNMLVGAVGEERARALIDRISIGGNSTGLESLKNMDGRAVADMIRNEHPQIVAIVVSYLESDHAAAVLTNLNEKMRSDVIMRIANLEAISPNALQELDEILERQFAGNAASKASVVGGLKRAADIVNCMDTATEEALMAIIRERDEALSTSIQELMFTFENLLDLDDRSVQRVLREVSGEDLVKALKGATPEIKALVVKNMSKRAAEVLEDDLQNRGPMRVSDVEAAQRGILATVRKLADAGEVMLGGEDYV